MSNNEYKYAVLYNDGMIYPSELEFCEATLKAENEKSRQRYRDVIDCITRVNRINRHEKKWPKGIYAPDNIEVVPVSLLEKFIQNSNFWNYNDDRKKVLIFDDIIEEHLAKDIMSSLFDLSFTFSEYISCENNKGYNISEIKFDDSVFIIGIEPEYEESSDEKIFKSICEKTAAAYQSTFSIIKIDELLLNELTYLENHFIQSHKRNGKFIRNHLSKMGQIFKNTIQESVYKKIIEAEKLIVIGSFPVGILIFPDYETSLCENIPIRYEPTSHYANLEARLLQINNRFLVINKTSKIVILELISLDDPIRKESDQSWNSFIYNASAWGYKNIEKKEINSIENFEQFIDEESRDIDLLIISSHGNVDYKTGETYLIVGENKEKWIPEHFSKFRFPKLVSLSACYSGARSKKNMYTVSDRILMNGATSVISTLFPISPKMNALLHLHLLTSISDAIQQRTTTNLTDLWSNLVTTAFLDEVTFSTPRIKSAFLDGGLYKEVVDSSKKKPLNKQKLISEIKNIALEYADEGIESFTIHDNFFSEGICYQILGNSDIVLIDGRSV